MRSKHFSPGLILVALLATVLAGSPAVAAAGSSVTDGAQSTNATTVNDSTANATLGNLTVWTAPGDEFANLTSSAAVESAKRGSWLTRSRTIAEHDIVVFELPAPGLVEAVAAVNDTDSDAAAFVAVLNRSDTDEFRMEQTLDTTGMEQKELNLSATLAADGIRVVPDERNGTLYVALRTDRVVVDWYGDRDRSVGDHEAYRVNLTVTDGNATTSSTVEWSLVERGVTFGDSNSEPVTFERRTGCVPVSGHTPIAPGTDLRIALRHIGDSTVVATDRVTVAPSGRFSTCLDTSSVSTETVLDVGVRGLPDYDTPVVDSRAELPSVSVEPGSDDTVVVTTRSIGSGFVLLYANGTRVSGSDLLDPGVHALRFDRPERDGRLTAVFSSTNADEPCDLSRDDGPLCASDTLVSTDRTGTPESGNGTDQPTTDGPTTATEATTASHRDGPGFGPVATTLALLAVALFARRRF